LYRYSAVNVWWLVKRGLTALLEATSASTRRRVRIYRNDDTVGLCTRCITVNPRYSLKAPGLNYWNLECDFLV
jgi:hypothetical protein